MKKAKNPERVPETMQSRFDAITEQIDAVCKSFLSNDYAKLARETTAALCRKRPSPVVNGRINSWACGVVYALGFVNFLFDPSQEPYLSATELCKKFDVSSGTGSSKSRIIRDALKMVQLDPNWCIPEMLENNPLAWTIMVNGLMVDAREMPREIQEIALQKGLIPYIQP